MKNETHRIWNFSERKFPHLVSYFLNAAAPSMYEIYRYPFMYRRFAGCFLFFRMAIRPAEAGRICHSCYPEQSILFTCHLLRMLFRTPQAFPQACLLLRTLSRMPQAFPQAYLLLRTLSRMLQPEPLLLFCSIQTDLRVP